MTSSEKSLEDIGFTFSNQWLMNYLLYALFEVTVHNKIMQKVLYPYQKPAKLKFVLKSVTVPVYIIWAVNLWDKLHRMYMKTTICKSYLYWFNRFLRDKNV